MNKNEALDFAIENLEYTYDDIEIYTDENGDEHTRVTGVHDKEALEVIEILKGLKDADKT